MSTGAITGRASSNRTSDATSGNATPAHAGNGEQLLRRGASGDDVRELQLVLNRAGAQPRLVEDGKLGAKTEAAIRAFQAARGLAKIDGIVGPETRAALNGEAPAPSRANAKVVGARDPRTREPAMPSGDVDVGAIDGADDVGSGDFASRVTARAEQDIDRVRPQERGASGGYKGWDYLQETFTKTTGWTPKDADVKKDSTPQDKHWCGIWATRMYQEAGVDVRWDLTKGKPVGDISYTQRPWQKDKAEAFRASVKPGDIVTVDGKYNHHALVVGVNADGSIETIDGNKPHIGRAHYALSQVNGYYRPTQT